ncbi:MAG: ribonuclease HI family protein [Zoogloeaceae bacterium]|nr:ribonuclease HI family protein [Zoogloeaceae bacterium]
MTEHPCNESTACWQAWCDGSAAPNPGKIGIGIVLISPEGTRMEKSLAIGRSGCNNQAELHALSLALDLALTAGSQTIHLSTDSKAATDWINGSDTTSAQPLATLIADIQQKMQHFQCARIFWIPRHKNGEADLLSRQALGLPGVVLREKSKHRKHH